MINRQRKLKSRIENDMINYYNKLKSVQLTRLVLAVFLVGGPRFFP